MVFFNFDEASNPRQDYHFEQSFEQTLEETKTQNQGLYTICTTILILYFLATIDAWGLF